MTAPVRVGVVRLRSGPAALALPAYQTPDAAGLDLLADIDHSLELAPGDRALVPTGIAIALPPGHEAQVRPRSGLALRTGVTILNAPGTIDADYRGEVQVLLVNLGRQPVTLVRGERIAQLVVGRVERIVWDEAGALPPSARGAGGFGSTGRGGTG